MLRLPKKIRVVSTWYKIAHDGLTKNKWGDADVDNGVIRLAKRFPSDELKAKTFIHEWWHCIQHEYDIDMPYDLEEKVALALENGFSALSKDHHDLLIKVMEAMGKE